MIEFTPEMSRFRQAMEMVKPFVEMAVKHSAVGAHRIPKSGPLMVIGNHRSHIDPLLVSSVFPRAMFWVGDHYLANIPVIGPYLKTLGYIPISHKRRDQLHAYKEVARAFKGGRAVGLFPEGHDYIVQNDFSKRLGKFNSGFANMAIRLKANVLPITIIGVQEQIKPWPIPPFVRSLFDVPDDVKHVENRLVYQEAQVVIGHVIDIEPYTRMKLSEGVEKLVAEGRAQIESAILEYGPEERRHSPNRQSGTRVKPDERPGL